MADILDEELEKGLRQAKKKPRNFAAICKGTKLLKLIVKKKPIKQPEIMAAKSEVQGNAIITGVCVGDGGAGMVFQVEGDEPSIKIPQMREYITEQTGLAIKPRFEVVQALEEVDENESESEESAADAPVANGDIPAAPPLPENTGSGLSGDGTLASQLMAALNKLTPAVKAAVVAHPARKETILRPVQDFQSHMKVQNLSAAKESLGQLSKILREVGTGETVPQAPPTPQPNVVAEEPPIAPPPPDPKALQWEQQFPGVNLKYLAALKTAPSDLAGKMKATFAYATEQAEARQFEKALVALGRLGPMIEEAAQGKGPAGDIPAGIVKARKFMISRWPQIPGELSVELSRLRNAIAEKVPEENPSEITEAIEKALTKFYAEMKVALDAAINQGDATYSEAQKVIGQLRAKLDKDPLIMHLKGNPIDDSVAIDVVLSDALNEVESALAG